MWLIVAILFIIFFAIYPYAVRVLARRRMLAHLCKALRRAGGKIRFLRRFPAFSGNRAKTFELLVRFEGVQYAVKLWSPKHQDTELRITADGKAYEMRTVGQPLTPRGHRRVRTLRGRPRAVPPTKTCFRTPSSLRRVNVLLIAPPYRRILRREKGEWRMLESGDAIFNKLLYTPSDFLATVRRNAAQS